MGTVSWAELRRTFGPSFRRATVASSSGDSISVPHVLQTTPIAIADAVEREVLTAPLVCAAAPRDQRRVLNAHSEMCHAESGGIQDPAPNKR